MVVVLEKREEWDGLIRKIVDDEKTVYFAGFDNEEAWRRALVFEKLWERTDGCEIIKSGSIPVSVVTMGQAAIAAYLFSVHRRSIEEVASELDVATSTVEQYLSDFRQGRR